MMNAERLSMRESFLFNCIRAERSDERQRGTQSTLAPGASAGEGGFHATMRFVCAAKTCGSAQREEFVATRQTAFNASNPVRR